MRGLVAILSLIIVSAGVAYASGNSECCPRCGCATICWEPVVAYRCKLVPESKPVKKVAFECKDIPFCLHKIPWFGRCNDCPDCEDCPRFKRVLIKKDVSCGETCGTKCVVEEFVCSVPRACSNCGHQPCTVPSPAIHRPATASQLSQTALQSQVVQPVYAAPTVPAAKRPTFRLAELPAAVQVEE